MKTKIAYNFNENSNLQDWKVVDDGVMGGKSAGKYRINSEGCGVFEGEISLANNGGFSSVRHRLNSTEAKSYTKIVLTLKGDMKNYQFRIKGNVSDRFSYISGFMTTGEWQEIEIVLSEMYPSFRGQKLNQPNFSDDTIQEIAFLIGNKENENFSLLIDKIELK